MIVKLDKKECECVCEFPRFSQEVRDYNSWDPPNSDGVPTDWYDDKKAYDDTENGGRFFNTFADQPRASIRFEPILPGLRNLFKSDMRTHLYCLRGSSAGVEIKTIYWGVEIIYVAGDTEGTQSSRRIWPDTQGKPVPF